jgi:Reverse transcriptase (RNA-dependent DNA polymerase)
MVVVVASGGSQGRLRAVASCTRSANLVTIRNLRKENLALALAHVGRNGAGQFNSKTAEDLWWQLRQGRGWRPCWTSEVESKLGKRFTVVRLPVEDAVIARAVERELRRHLEKVLPPEQVGLVRGSSLQVAMRRTSSFVCAHPNWFVARFDVEGFFENLKPAVALKALKKLGAPDDVIEALRKFYRVNGKRFDGIGRGLSFAPLLGGVALLEVLRVVRKHVQDVVWTGDDFLLFSPDLNAVQRAKDAADLTLGELGLSPSPSKSYLGPVAGPWEFAGLRFEDLLPHPKPGATDRLIEKVDAAMVEGKPEKASRVLAGWAGQYLPAAESEEILKTSADLSAKYGSRLPKLTDIMFLANARAVSRTVPQIGKKNSRSLSPGRAVASSSWLGAKNSSSLVSTRAMASTACVGVVKPTTRVCPSPRRKPGAGATPIPPSGTQPPSLPSRFLRALKELRSRRFWADGQRELLRFHVEAGRISGREGARSIHRSIWRARRVIRKRPRTKTKATWWARMKDGQLLVCRGSSASAIPPP